MKKVLFICKETTYGEIEIEIPDNYTNEDIEDAREKAIDECEWTGKMEISIESEEIMQNK